LAQRASEINGPAVLVQQIAKGFLGQFLEVHHAVACQEIEGMPSLIVELDAFAWHRRHPDSIAGDSIAGPAHSASAGRMRTAAPVQCRLGIRSRRRRLSGLRAFGFFVLTPHQARAISTKNSRSRFDLARCAYLMHSVARSLKSRISIKASRKGPYP
jgi:hypothetical protein